jgi:hypothetical protein
MQATEGNGLAQPSANTEDKARRQAAEYDGAQPSAILARIADMLGVGAKMGQLPTGNAAENVVACGLACSAYLMLKQEVRRRRAEHDRSMIIAKDHTIIELAASCSELQHCCVMLEDRLHRVLAVLADVNNG